MYVRLGGRSHWREIRFFLPAPGAGSHLETARPGPRVRVQRIHESSGRAVVRLFELPPREKGQVHPPVEASLCARKQSLLNTCVQT